MVQKPGEHSKKMQPEPISEQQEEEVEEEVLEEEIEQEEIEATPEPDASSQDSESTIEKLRPKLSHPGEHMNIPDKIMLTDAEDDNLANQDLNNDEILELKRQLNIMKKNQAYKVSAQNDEDD